MTLRLTQLHFAAVVLAIAVVSLSAPTARAFTTEILGGSADGGSRFADPDDQVKNFGRSAQPFGQNGPIVQFGAQPGLQSPFSHFPGAGFGPSSQPPQPYARPPGNGD